VTIPVYENESSAEDIVNPMAERLWRDNPEQAMCGLGTFSAETGGLNETTNSINLASSMIGLAAEDPSRFIFLVSHLDPVFQDIVIQHYMLGRNFAQIGAVLYPEKSQGHALGAELMVKRGNQKALRQLAEVLKNGGRVERRRSVRVVRIKAARDLGDFVIHPNGQLGELFALGWSVLSRASSWGFDEC